MATEHNETASGLVFIIEENGKKNKNTDSTLEKSQNSTIAKYRANDKYISKELPATFDKTIKMAHKEYKANCLNSDAGLYGVCSITLVILLPPYDSKFIKFLTISSLSYR